MKWRTAISTRKDGELYVRGKKLSDLMQTVSFSEASFLLFSGRMPNEQERKLFDMVLVSCIEHGIEAPSAFSARVSASVGNPMNAALAAGILATGTWHGGAVEEAARYIQSEESAGEVVSKILKTGGRLSGYGHKIYKKRDPRAEQLLEEAQKMGIGEKDISKARALGEEFAKQSGNTLPLNIDMAIAAIVSAFGFDYRLGKALYAFARMPGIIAHAHEEAMNEKPYRRIDEADVEYIGPAV